MAIKTAALADVRCGRPRALWALMASGVVLAGCASTSPEMAARGVHPYRGGAGAHALGPPSSTAVAGGRYKLGAPYEAGGLWYVPAEQSGYDEVGVASWYGDEFDGKATANGEIFDKYAASGAHATLPMPSIVEVTNLDNGRTVRVRVNDRGPFKNGRLIDLSRGAAQALGYMDKGTAQVRVRYIGPARMDGTLEPLFVAKADKAAPRPAQRPAASSAEIAQTPLAPPAPSGPSAWRAADSRAGEGGRYAVQAGAFSDRARAERAAETLAAAGAAVIRPAQVAGRQLYRVVVGSWRDEDQAAAGRAQIASLGFADARVVKTY